MSPAEFFRIQDLYDQIKDLMLQSVVPKTIKEKLLILNSLNQAFISDKLEFIPLMLDFKILEMTQRLGDLIQKMKLMKSYLAFKDAHPAFNHFKSKELS